MNHLIKFSKFEDWSDACDYCSKRGIKYIAYYELLPNLVLGIEDPAANIFIRLKFQ